MCIFYYTTWVILHNNFEVVSNSIGELSDHTLHAFKLQFPESLTENKHLLLWSGNTLEWCKIEILIFMFYLMTFMMMLIKSRIINIGVDVSYLFEPLYMSLIVNRIIESIDMDVNQTKKTHS